MTLRTYRIMYWQMFAWIAYYIPKCFVFFISLDFYIFFHTCNIYSSSSTNGCITRVYNIRRYTMYIIVNDHNILTSCLHFEQKIIIENRLEKTSLFTDHRRLEIYIYRFCNLQYWIQYSTIHYIDVYLKQKSRLYTHIRT